MEERRYYAIGQQDFKTLREDEAVYIDKTPFVEKIAASKSKYLFLSRPRRFGKSLFLSTLRYFFEGQRELFKGLYIDSTDWKWEEYPVLYLDLNTDRYDNQGMLDSVLDNLLRGWEEKYGVEVRDTEFSQRFRTILETVHKITGKQVVILVDEYDKPLVGNLNHGDIFEQYRRKLAGVYSNFKSSAEHIRLVFMTGVSRFGKLSVFSDLNNLKDITFSDEYADICGITEKELFENFRDGIERLAQGYRVSYETMCARLKKSYDGYRFSPKGSDIYNPWSVLRAMDESRIGTYWNNTGGTTVVVEALRDADVDIEATLNSVWKLDELAGMDLLNADPTPLLYQTGYLTIADYDLERDEVRLKIPNEEVRKGLFNDLLRVYLKPKGSTVKSIIDGIIRSIRDGKPEEMMKNLKAFFAGIPYDLKMDNENNFHNAFYILTTLIGIDSKAEVHTSDGRIDLLIETPKYIYILELKYDGSAEEAARQIEEKHYDLKYSTNSRTLYNIGVNFSSKNRRIEDWVIHQVSES